jgi:uncharacterized protein (TIGR02147 family)
MSAFQFTDSRPFLRKFIASLPAKGHGEASRIARELRVSTTLISQILSGEKSFTPEQAAQMVAYLGLTGLEAEYFTSLVYYERAGSKPLQDYWKTKLDDLRERALQMSTRLKTDRKLNDVERSVFYSDPLYSAVRLYTSVGESGRTLEEISERFTLTRAKAANYIDFLVQTGLCLEKEGRIFFGAQKTHLEQSSPYLLRHQVDWRLRAIRRRENLKDQEMMYTSVVSLSKKDFAILREEMATFIETFLARVHASPAEEIACFNLDFFWVEK